MIQEPSFSIFLNWLLHIQCSYCSVALVSSPSRQLNLAIKGELRRQWPLHSIRDCPDTVTGVCKIFPAGPNFPEDTVPRLLREADSRSDPESSFNRLCQVTEWGIKNGYLVCMGRQTLELELHHDEDFIIYWSSIPHSSSSFNDHTVLYHFLYPPSSVPSSFPFYHKSP